MNDKTIETMNFEQSMRELETIVERLEKGEIPLEEAIHAYERGVALSRHCEKKLKDAQRRIEKIVIDKDGAVSSQPAE